MNGHFFEKTYPEFAFFEVTGLTFFNKKRQIEGNLITNEGGKGAIFLGRFPLSGRKVLRDKATWNGLSRGSDAGLRRHQVCQRIARIARKIFYETRKVFGALEAYQKPEIRVICVIRWQENLWEGVSGIYSGQCFIEFWSKRTLEPKIVSGHPFPFFRYLCF